MSRDAIYTPSKPADVGLNRVFVHLFAGVTGAGTSGNPYVWDGTIVTGVENVLVEGYWTLTGTVLMNAHYTRLAGQGEVKITYTGTGDAIHVHTSAVGDPDTGEDDSHVTYFQTVDNIELYVAGSGSGPAVAGTAIDVHECHMALIRKVRIRGRWTNGIWMGNANGVHLEHPVVAGTVNDFDAATTESPDYGLRFGTRTGDLFGAQNITIVNPWVRFQKKHSVYFETNAAVNQLVMTGGQIGDSVNEPLLFDSGSDPNYLSIACNFIGVDMESDQTTSPLDANGRYVTINVRGREHRFLNCHTFGAVLFNDSVECKYEGGYAEKIWLMTSAACSVEDVLLFSEGGKYWDAGSSNCYYVRVRQDNGLFSTNVSLGAGEFDAMCKNIVVIDDSQPTPAVLNFSTGQDAQLCFVGGTNTSNAAQVGLSGTFGHHSGYTAGYAYLSTKDKTKGVALGWNAAGNGPAINAATNGATIAGALTVSGSASLSGNLNMGTYTATLGGLSGVGGTNIIALNTTLTAPWSAFKFFNMPFSDGTLYECGMNASGGPRILNMYFKGNGDTSLAFQTGTGPTTRFQISDTQLAASVPISIPSNGLIFSGTTTSPSDTSTAAAWALVTAGTNTYRLPLYT